MPATQSALSDEAKVARRHAALQRYAAKQTQIQASCFWKGTLRSKPASQEQKQQQLSSATKYRKKNREHICISDAARRDEKRLRQEAVKALQSLSRQPPAEATQKSGAYVMHPTPRPALATNTTHAARNMDDSDNDCSSESSSMHPNSPISGPVFYADGCASSRPHSPTPDLDCNCRWPQYCGKCTCGCDYMCCLYHHEDESEYRKWMKQLTCEERGLPSPYKDIIDYKF
ncbi:hypothetical protein C8R43DRAFT_941718 [Mycena crocata]|nr:hypothetical protein C8R43DRAFT_941718 [Mycena crocata]